MYTKCTQNIHTMYTKCTQNVHKIYAKYTQNVHKIYTQCTQNVHKMYTKYTQNIHTMYTKYTQNVHKIPLKICYKLKPKKEEQVANNRYSDRDRRVFDRIHRFSAQGHPAGRRRYTRCQYQSRPSQWNTIPVTKLLVSYSRTQSSRSH